MVDVGVWYKPCNIVYNMWYETGYIGLFHWFELGHTFLLNKIDVKLYILLPCSYY